MNDRWISAVGILKPETLRRLEALSSHATNVVDGWAATNPEQLKTWETDGSLMQRAKEVEDETFRAQEKARADGMTHLAPHEINELYGGPSSRL